MKLKYILISGLIVILLVAGCFSLAVAGETRSGWSSETITTSGYDAVLDLDSSGFPHVTYATTGADSEMTLMYATDKSGSWVSEVADTEGYVGEDSAITVDTSGNVHVCYKSPAVGQTNHLNYAKRSNSGWAIEVVDDALTTGYYCSIALTPGGAPHISYMDLTNDNNDLMYATRSGSSWATEIVDFNGNVGGYSSIVIDSQGIPHISYRDATFSALKYATKSGGSWSIETIDTNDDPSHPSIDIDSQNRPHIVYTAYPAGLDSDLRYAAYDGSAWNIETLDDGDVHGSDRTSIDINKIDDEETVHIAYTTYLDLASHETAIKYAKSTNGGAWTSELLSESDALAPQVRVNASGGVNILYEVLINDVQAIKLARQIEGTIPGAPGNLVATPGSGSVTLNWDAPLNDGGDAISGYRIYGGESSGASTLVGTTTGQASFIETGLTNGVTYYYTVTAINSIGEGARSAEVSVTPTETATPTVIDDGGSSLTMSVGDVLPFTLEGEEYSIELEAVDAEGATVIISSTPQTVNLDIGQTKLLDLNSDGSDDLEITLDSVDTVAQTARFTMSSVADSGGGLLPGFGLDVIIISMCVAMMIINLARRKSR